MKGKNEQTSPKVDDFLQNLFSAAVIHLDRIIIAFTPDYFFAEKFFFSSAVATENVDLNFLLDVERNLQYTPIFLDVKPLSS